MELAELPMAKGVAPRFQKQGIGDSPHLPHFRRDLQPTWAIEGGRGDPDRSGLARHHKLPTKKPFAPPYLTAVGMQEGLGVRNPPEPDSPQVCG